MTIRSLLPSVLCLIGIFGCATSARKPARTATSDSTCATSAQVCEANPDCPLEFCYRLAKQETGSRAAEYSAEREAEFRRHRASVAAKKERIRARRSIEEPRKSTYKGYPQVAGNALSDDKQYLFRNYAKTILKCLHPSGQYYQSVGVSSEVRDNYYIIHGNILWHGGVVGIAYTTAIELKLRDDNYAKVNILKDNAYIPGGLTCGLSQWTPLNKYGTESAAAGRRLLSAVLAAGVGAAALLEQQKRLEEEKREKEAEERIRRQEKWCAENPLACAVQKQADAVQEAQVEARRNAIRACENACRRENRECDRGDTTILGIRCHDDYEDCIKDCY